MGQPPSAFELNLRRFFGGGGERNNMAERDAAGLPYSQSAIISTLRSEYEEAARHGGQVAVDKCFNLAWALVHSREPADVKMGLELLDALLSAEDADRRELLYLQAVGQFRLRRNVEARRILKGVIQEYPDFRQAEALVDACESEIVKDGLVGVGAGVAVLGVVAAITAAAMRKK